MKFPVECFVLGLAAVSVAFASTSVAVAAPLAMTPVIQSSPAVTAAAPETPVISGQAQVEALKPQAPLRLVDKQEFCKKLAQSFANIGASSGFDRVHTALLGNGAAVQVVEDFRSGRASDYMRAALLRTIANVPAVAGDNSYLPISSVVGEAMGVGSNAALALSSGELRYIPAAQHGTDLVVIAQNAASLTPERAQKVAEIARAQEIHVSIVWVGAGDEGQDKQDARTLGWLAAVTGGAFANLGGQISPCGSSL